MSGGCIAAPNQDNSNPTARPVAPHSRLPGELKHMSVCKQDTMAMRSKRTPPGSSRKGPPDLVLAHRFVARAPTSVSAVIANEASRSRTRTSEGGKRQNEGLPTVVEHRLSYKRAYHHQKDAPSDSAAPVDNAQVRAHNIASSRPPWTSATCPPRLLSSWPSRSPNRREGFIPTTT